MSNGNGRAREMTRHHIVPVSRLNGRTMGEENIAVLSRSQHEAYHTLFENKTPDEVIIHLVNHFWNRESNWVWVALHKLQD